MHQAILPVELADKVVIFGNNEIHKFVKEGTSLYCYTKNDDSSHSICRLVTVIACRILEQCYNHAYSKAFLSSNLRINEQSVDAAVDLLLSLCLVSKNQGNIYYMVNATREGRDVYDRLLRGHDKAKPPAEGPRKAANDQIRFNILRARNSIAVHSIPTVDFCERCVYMHTLKINGVPIDLYWHWELNDEGLIVARYGNNSNQEYGIPVKLLKLDGGLLTNPLLVTTAISLKNIGL